MVWSAIMELLQGLRQSTSAMMVLFWWGVSPGSARVMGYGMGAYLSAFQIVQVHIVDSIHALCNEYRALYQQFKEHLSNSYSVSKSIFT